MVEASESFTVSLSSLNIGSFSEDSATVTINDSNTATTTGEASIPTVSSRNLPFSEGVISDFASAF